MAKPYISIAGGIGVGKSTFATLLASKLGCACFLESAGDRNPFLADFYRDRRRWAFHSQSFFISEAMRQQQEISLLRRGAIQDRSVWEHIEIFGRDMHESGDLSENEFELLRALADSSNLPVPDLMVYMKAKPRDLQKRIEGRAREYEQGITLEDLEAMSRRYQEWIEDWSASPLLVIDASTADPRKPEQLDALAEQVKTALQAVSSSSR